jgi:hypothetical protein
MNRCSVHLYILLSSKHISIGAEKDGVPQAVLKCLGACSAGGTNVYDIIVSQKHPSSAIKKPLTASDLHYSRGCGLAAGSSAMFLAFMISASLHSSLHLYQNALVNSIDEQPFLHRHVWFTHWLLHLS